MRTNKILFFSLLTALFFGFSGCEEDNPTFDTFGEQTLSFRVADFDVSVPEEDLTLEIPVTISTLASQSRTYSVSITNSPENSASEYTVGSITVPAGQYDGMLTVDFDFSEIGGPDGEIRELELTIDAAEGITPYNKVVSINYFREIICNDLELTIISDVWATETGFRLEQADGTIIVNDFFPFGANSTEPQEYYVQFTLPDGDYIFTLLDTYGDGQEGSGGGVTLTGSYLLNCSIIVHASGEGALDNGTFESTPFTVNP